MTANPYRSLPSVDRLAAEFEGRLPAPVVTDTMRIVLDQARTDIAAGLDVDVRREAERVIMALERSAGVEVVNATGVLLHTNLGRALWSDAALTRAAETARRYTNLELELETGERAHRGSYVTALLRALTGAEDALVVNNNAAAVLLSLAATAAGKSVPVARGELIEIGGSYRLPEVMWASGARLVEVGTTNRTRLGDYATALQVHRCGAILKVHPSNYRIEGFTEEASVSQLADLAHSEAMPLLYDIGSGLLDAATPWLESPPPAWLRAEPAARQSLEAGADLVTFSGDKLLGGPQAGVVVGRAESVQRLRDHALARALRVDGVTLVALAATLEAYAQKDVSQIPFWRQALLTGEELTTRAAHVASRLSGQVIEGSSTVGAGSAPGTAIPTPQVLLAGEDHLFGALLDSDPPILARREGGGLLVDLRTVEPEADDIIVESVIRCR